MSERSGASTLAAMSLEEPGGEQASPRAAGPLRCGPCTVWPRQQTWLCAVPLVMGFVGLGLSLMLLKWIVVGSVQDYVPTDLVDAKGIGQDPIFMSQPSAVPKGPDAAATTTAMAATTTVAVVSTTTLLAADGTAPVPRTRPPSNHSSANGGNNHAPHLHNRVGNRVPGTSTTTARTTRLTPPVGKDATPRSTTVRRGNGHSNVRPVPTSTSTTTTTVTPTASTTAKSTVKVLPPTSPPVPPAKPTRWNHGRSATRPHNRHRTLAPTSPSLRSEVFKPCIDDKDLAFCLNEGECSIIETVAGVHRHCRCKEGYHGLRCDQFVPKTDAILSDPTADELGIEFMESRETYQRQVLSICSIASGICLLGVACMVLYRRNRRRREKLRAHLSESRILRDCSINGPKLMSKSSPRPQCGLHKCCKSHGTSSPPGGSLACGPAATTPPILNRALSKGKRFRSSSLCLSPAQRHRETHHFSTPPILRGKQNLIGGTRVAGHVYRHLQDVESTEMEVESVRGLVSQRERGPGQTGSNTRMQAPMSDLAVGKGWSEVPCTRLDVGAASSSPPPPPPSPPPSSPLWARSIPIIPSLQGCDNEGGSVNTGRWNQGVCSVPGRHGDASSSSAAPAAPPSEAALAGESPARHADPAVGDSGPAFTCAEPPETVVEPEGASKHKRLVILATALNSQHSMNIATAVTVLESEGKRVRYTPRLLYSCSGVRGSRPGAQEPGEWQCPPVAGGTNCDTAALGSCRGSGIACAKPSAS